MTVALKIFTILLISGLMLVGAEIFVPGGVLGVLGGVALIGAIVAAVAAFGIVTGGYIAFGIIILLGIVIALWIRYFPKTRIGRSMTVEQDMASAKATESGLADLLDQEGETTSELHPSGFATLGGRRIDVVTQGEMISKGQRVKVVEVEGNRVVVEAVADTPQV